MKAADTDRLSVIAMVLPVLAIVAVTALAKLEIRRTENFGRTNYTTTIKKRDIADAARNAFVALGDAEIQAQDYALTGETVYKEAFKQDLINWEDESGTLTLVAVNDDGSPSAKELVEAGNQTVEELHAIVSSYDKAGRNDAIERIAKSSAVVYLEQAHKAYDKIREQDGSFEGSNRIRGRSLLALDRIAYAIEAAAGVSLLCLVVIYVRRNKKANAAVAEVRVGLAGSQSGS